MRNGAVLFVTRLPVVRLCIQMCTMYQLRLVKTGIIDICMYTCWLAAQADKSTNL